MSVPYKHYFIALDLPAQVVSELVRAGTYVQDTGLVRGRFVPQDKLHSTLKFLGNVTAEQLQEVKKRLALIKQPLFTLMLNGLSVFTDHEHIRIVYAHVESQQLSSLVAQLQTLFADLVAPDNRPFVGHITLARVDKVKHPYRFMAALQNYTSALNTFNVTELVLKGSEQTSQGIVYHDLAHYPLAPSDCK